MFQFRDVQNLSNNYVLYHVSCIGSFPFIATGVSYHRISSPSTSHISHTVPPRAQGSEEPPSFPHT